MCKQRGTVVQVADGSELGDGSTDPGVAPPPNAAPDEFVRLVREFEPSISKYLAERAEEATVQQQRRAILDQREQDRRDALNHAQVELLEQCGSLADRLFELVETATAFIKSKIAAPPAQQ